METSKIMEIIDEEMQLQDKCFVDACNSKNDNLSFAYAQAILVLKRVKTRIVEAMATEEVGNG